MDTLPIIDRRKVAEMNAPMSALPVQMAMPNPIPQMSAPLPLVSRIPTQTENDTAKLNGMVANGSGIDQIDNKFGRIAARTANTIGTIASVFAPPLRGALMAIPGTNEHHQLLVHQQRANVANDNANDLATAQTEDAQALTDQRRALATQEQAKANRLDDPTKLIDSSKTVQTDDGVYQMNPQTGRYDVRVGDRVEKPKSPEQTVFDAGLAAGKSPQDALSDVYNAKNVKDATTAQMFANGYRKAHPEASDMDVATATIRATQTDPKITVINAGAANRAAGNAPEGTPGTNGDQYLASLPAQRQQLVKSTAAGDIAIPPAGSRAPGAQQLRQDVLQYDPTYTDARYKGKQQFKGSGDADKIVQLATALAHGQRLQRNSDKLGFSPAISMGIGPDSTAYNEDVNHYTDELGRLVKGGILTGGEEVINKKGVLSPTHESRSAAITEKNELLAGKVSALFQKYKTATGEDLPIDNFFDAKTAPIVRGLGVGVGTAGGPEVWVRDSKGKLVKQ